MLKHHLTTLTVILFGVWKSVFSTQPRVAKTIDNAFSNCLFWTTIQCKSFDEIVLSISLGA